MNLASVPCGCVPGQNRSEDDMPDSLEECMPKEWMIARTRGALPLARKSHGKIVFIGLCGPNILEHQNHKNTKLWLTLACNLLWCHCDMVGTEPVSAAGVTGGLSSLLCWKLRWPWLGRNGINNLILTGPEAPCILGIAFLRSGHFKDPKGLFWALG